ncbi:MAG: hypothetical protein GTN89_16585, partial [Acidobacteria bacterium]|nr:hypothetical protein [Acidobacteriota bacterium]
MSEPPVYLTEPGQASTPATAFNFREYLQLLRRRWPLIAACLIVGVGIGYLQFYLTPRMYRARTTLQIEQGSLLGVAEVNPFVEAWTGIKYY